MAFITRGHNSNSFQASSTRTKSSTTLQSKLQAALEASNKAGQAFAGASEQAASAPLSDIKDCFHEASEDNKGKNSSQYGTQATAKLKILSQRTRSASQLGRAAGRAQVDCRKQLEEARHLIRGADLSPEVSRSLEQALKKNENSRGSAQIVQRELDRLSTPLTTMETNAWSVGLDENPTGIMDGRDVSQAARDGENTAENCASPLQKATTSAHQGANNQQEVSRIILGVLNHLEQHQQTAPSPQPRGAQTETTGPRYATPTAAVSNTPSNPIAVLQELESIMESPAPTKTSQAPTGFASLAAKRPSAIGDSLSLAKIVAGAGESSSNAPSILAFDF